MKIESQSKQISEIFMSHCKKKNYQIEIKEIAHAIRVVVSNLKDRSLVDVFHTGKIQIGGAQSDLKNEMHEIKKQFEENPGAFVVPQRPVKPSVARYDIISDELKAKLKQVLQGIAPTISTEENPDSKSEYRLKVVSSGFSLSATQFKNGTLLLQGKADDLFDHCCSEIEKVAAPTGREIVARFISSDEKAVDQFMRLNTPQLLIDAETAVKAQLGAAYHFLTDHDQKWLIASEALCQSQIPMPEYSPYVMPASKAFEGFCKKILTAIGLFDPAHFNVKGANFSNLSNYTEPRRVAICAKEKHAETFLKRVVVQLEICRNFMMHSDASVVTKVNSAEEGRKKIDQISSEITEIFGYFRGLYSL